MLSWPQVREIVARLDALKPYGPFVRDSLLKIEDVNFANGAQRQLYAFGVSAKRYCLFVESPNGPNIVKASEHGLGHLLNPTDPEDKDRGPSGAPKWIEEVWRHLVLRSRGEKTPPSPSWFARSALARHGFTSLTLLRPVLRQQKDRSYPEQVKPFNFALTGYLAMDGAPEGVDPATCHLIGPFERDPSRWESQDWYDTSSGVACRITTRERTSPRVARVKSVADIVAEYEAHPESKSAGPDGQPADSRTVGLLQRRHVEPVYFYRIGKESNRYEEVDRGEMRSLDEVQELLENPRATARDTIFLPLLDGVPMGQLAQERASRRAC